MKNIILQRVSLVFVLSFFCHHNAAADNQSTLQDLRSTIEQTKKLSSYSPATKIKDPLLVVVIMVKNEETVIKDTLKPFIDAGVKHYLVFDTGSTDKTIQVTQNYFQDKDIQHGIIKQEPFVDFATSRNRALELAEQAFPNACFMIMPDAEWQLQNVPTLLKFCEENKDDTCNAYAVRIINGTNLDYPNHRLLRCKSGARFFGAVHEYVNGGITDKKIPTEVYFSWHATAAGREKSGQRWFRDLDILKKEHEKNPLDPRSIFYLAQTYDCLGDLENACIYYEKRATMPGWDEETFMARYRLAQMHERLERWDQALYHYTIAYSARPHRAEPLVRLARHYQHKDDFPCCQLFAAKAIEIDYPKQDGLFVEKHMYDYERYHLLAIACWYLQDYEVGEKAAELALAGCPQDKDLIDLAHRNLNCYINRKKLLENKA